VLEAFLLHEPADAEHPEPPVRRGTGDRLREEPGDVVAEPMVDAVDPRFGGDALQVPAVGLGARDREARREQLPSEQPGRVQRLRVDVLRVARERERDAGDPRRVPGDRRRSMREVGVEVADVRKVEEPVGEGDALEELLEEDLARSCEAGRARAAGERDRERGGAEDSRRPTPERAAERRQEAREVGDEPDGKPGA
jgi:hypothetical protein